MFTEISKYTRTHWILKWFPSISKQATFVLTAGRLSHVAGFYWEPSLTRNQKYQKFQRSKLQGSIVANFRYFRYFFRYFCSCRAVCSSLIGWCFLISQSETDNSMKGNLRLSSEGACSLLNADRSNYDSNETKSKTLATNNKRYLIRNFTQPYRISHENGKYRKKTFEEMQCEISLVCTTFRTIRSI